MLLDATRPIIYAGGGVHASGAHEALTAVAEYIQAGVVQSAEGKGSVSDQSDLALGAALWPKNPLREYLDAADTIFVVGSRCAVAAFQPNQKIVQLDVDAEEIGRNHPVAVGLVGDARLTLERLLERLRTDAPPKPSRKREREQLREALIGLDTQEPNHSILASLRAGTPEDAIVIAGMTQIGYYSRPFWPVHRPRTYLTSSYSGNLGFEVPTALGAKVARPDRAVVCITGDGGFMYNSQELSTAAREKINAVIVLFNDEAYGNVARDLDESWGGTHGASRDQSRLHEARRRVRRGRHARDQADRRRRSRPQGGRDGSPRADRGAGGTDGAPGLLRADEGARQVPEALTGRRGPSRPPPFWWPA